ncbi:laccase-like, partial [Asbolus verrucosus]
NCEECTFNFTNWKEIIAVNRQIPGPSIQICQNDVLVVDVTNKIPEHSLTVHWRGQPNNEAPYMDGVPLITQCPIPSYTTFQYKFRVSSPGTHLYHAFSDQDRSRGLLGALIVRQPDRIDPLRKYYDIDSKHHIILISETSDKTLLINGRDPFPTGAALSIFNVKRNKRYRFRVAYTGGKLGCPVTLSIDNHLIKIIALDGNPISPSVADSIILSKGERVDFVLKTNQDTNDYFLRVKSCDGNGLALINYEGSRKGRDDRDKELKNDERSFDTALCESKIGRVCLGGVKSLQKIPEQLKKQPEKVMYLSFGSRIVNVNGEFSSRVYGINNLTFSYPSSPLLTQLSQISLSSVCDEVNVPEKCLGKDVCECVHVEYVRLGSSTEIILINQDISDEEHVFHLHGYRFYVVGFRQFDDAPVAEEIKLLDQQNVLFKRNFNNPILKDTIRVSKNSVVGLRFLADNPGRFVCFFVERQWVIIEIFRVLDT